MNNCEYCFESAYIPYIVKNIKTNEEYIFCCRWCFDDWIIENKLNELDYQLC